MTKQLSKYQIEIDDKYRNTNHNIIIKAGPGSGKSFMIKHLLKATPKYLKSILIAFNKSIADELKGDVPEYVKVSTIHSLAYSILRQNTNQNYKVNSFKNYILGKKYLKLDHLKEKQRDAYLFTISKIIDLSRLNLCRTHEEIQTICDIYNISTINGEINDVITLIDKLDEYNNRDSYEFMIDFTDMLYLAYKKVKKVNFPKFNVVFCDELQDLNPLQKVIVESIISPVNGRFIGVGDDRQSIYSFMGSNLESFESFIQRPNTIVLPLSVTYRCGKNIVTEANKVFEGLEPYEMNSDGLVRWGSLSEVEDNDFVICRNNLPLVEAWIEIVKSGKKAHILGKDFGQNLISILNKLTNFKTLEEGIEILLREKEEKLREKGITNPKQTSNYQQLIEKLSIIEILEKEFGSFEKLEKTILEVFSDEEKGGVILMTIHKSKGLEADNVFALNFHKLLPSKYAVTELELYQEKCLKYVCITRARNQLIYADL